MERTFGPSRFNHLRRPATPPPEWHIDGAGAPAVRYGRPRRAKRAPAPAPAPAPLGDSGHLVLPDDCVWPPPEMLGEKRQTGGRPRPRADKFVAKSIVRNNGGALRHVEPCDAIAVSKTSGSPTKSSSMEFPAPLSPKAKDLVPSPQAKEPGVARQGSVVLEGSG